MNAFLSRRALAAGSSGRAVTVAPSQNPYASALRLKKPDANACRLMGVPSAESGA